MLIEAVSRPSGNPNLRAAATLLAPPVRDFPALSKPRFSVEVVLRGKGRQTQGDPNRLQGKISTEYRSCS